MFWNATHNVSQLSKLGEPVSLIGRVVSFRRQGGVAFGHLQDIHGTVQFCFQKRELGDKLKEWSDQIQLGNFIGVSGKLDKSSTGTLTVFVSDFKLLQKAAKSFPDKWNGIEDQETRQRKRYLDCTLNEETRKTFRLRSNILSYLRNYLESHSFLEVETPILCAKASGAQAKPFVTHHNALDSDLFLRIAPETYLKRAVASGFSKVFEIGKNFRNEGIDPSHLQEFTACEWYVSGWDYKDNLSFFHEFLFALVSQNVTLTTNNEECFIIRGGTESEIRFPKKPEVLDYRTIFNDISGMDCDTLSSKEADQVFKEKVRPNIIAPTYLIDYPAHLSPMAARKTDDDKTAQQWQFIINGWEVVKCYTELVDPDLQRKLLEEQAVNKNNGDIEAMDLEEDFLECMEHGMPPMSGLGIGIDRLVCLLTGNKNLRDVVLFPTLLTK